jgi:mannose-6-phosphate isomerase-like protein (cupin superfamily)
MQLARRDLAGMTTADNSVAATLLFRYRDHAHFKMAIGVHFWSMAKATVQHAGEKVVMKRKGMCVKKNRDFFDGDIREIAIENHFFRQVIYTGPYSQLVVMSIPSGEDVGEKILLNTDVVLVIVEGQGQVILNGKEQLAREHGVIFVTAGTRHNIKNTGSKALKVVTVYAPSEYADGTVQKTKEEAMMLAHPSL